MQKIMLSLSISLSILFTQMSNPMTMGLIVLIQTIMMSLLSGMLSTSFWFSYILFLVFLGGVLILFIYMASMASNEMISLSTKMMLMTINLVVIMLLIIQPENLNGMEMINQLMMNITESELKFSLMKLYNTPTNLMTISLAMYLLLTLIVAVKITSISEGPLRVSN